jgi:F-type H+-transporting ATPase subunit b
MLIADSNFLIPNGTFIVVLVAFILVLGFIGRVVVPVLNDKLTERQNQIRGELEAADRAKADAEEADVERRAVLEEARAHAREIVSLANITAERAVAAAEEQANQVAARIRQAADAEVATARQAAVEEVTASVGTIVLAAAERVIGREIRAEDHRDLIDEAITAIRAESATGAAAGAVGAAGGGR